MDRRLILLELLAAPGLSRDLAEPVTGTTRLQKFLFLLEKERGIAPAEDGFEFFAFKFGPCSTRVYDDLEMLENLGLIETASAAHLPEEEEAEQELSFEYLMGDSEGEPLSRQEVMEKRYRITPEGLKLLEKLERQIDDEEGVHRVRKETADLKRTFGTYTLRELIRYVYVKYPDYTTESEIKDQIL